MLLNTQTYYSYKFGTWKPQDLLQQAEAYGYSSVCITDINNTSAVLESMRMYRENEVGIRVMPGIDFRNGAEQLFVALPKNNDGFETINRYLSHYLHQQEPIPAIAPDWEDVMVIYPVNFNQSLPPPGRGLGGGLLPQYNKPTPACPAGRPHSPPGEGTSVETNIFPGVSPSCALRLETCDPYIGIRPHDIQRLKFSPLRKHTDRMVMLPTVTFRNKKDFNTHRLLRAMDNNLLLSKLPKSEEGDPRHVLMPKEELLKYYEEFPEIVRNTEQLLEQLEVDFEFRKSKNKSVFTTSVKEDMTLLRAECEKGLSYRYGKADDTIRKRLEHELDIIGQMDFASYFLINWDIVKHAREQGFFHVGRGSGANSVAAYLLRITDVDPIELDLYFERFINPHRATPPDFDVDFSWADREHMTQYIFDTHGWDKVALQATYSTFQSRAVTRELGKVLGVPAHEIDQLQQTGRNHGIGKYGDLILQYSKYMAGFPSHLSIHASGILISDQPINAYTPTFLPPKGYPTTQFDMIAAEDLGLYKFDILSQRGLGKIRDSIEIIQENQGDIIDIHDIKRFKQDEEIKVLLREARAIGCFYVESPAMRMLLTKLRAEDYLGLVAASSVIRPGVSKSGMMREFIHRFRDEDRREQAREYSPELYDILEETYGVMVYQEDVIRVAHYFAGLDLADADILRRGMSWKFKQRNEFHRVKGRFFENCKAKGYPDEVTQKVWVEIESFANFAFAKGHSASYAVESYQALFLKAYYPIEYMVATVNNGGGFYRSELYIHEARMHGADIEAPCVNSSDKLCTLRGKTVILGFGMVKELEDRTVNLLIQAREEGLFDSVADFVDRVSIGIEQLELLVKVGAFRFTGKSKKQLTWEARLLLGGTKKKQVQPRLFLPKPRPYQFPDLYTAPLEEAFDQMELLGFPLCDPFMLAKEDTSDGILAADVPRFLGKTVVAYGYLVTSRRTNTHKGEEMYFGNFLDHKGYFLDSVHFPPVAAKYPFSGRGIYRIAGIVTEEFGCYSIEATELHRVPYIDDPRYAEDQDYKGTKDHSMINFVRG